MLAFLVSHRWNSTIEKSAPSHDAASTIPLIWHKRQTIYYLHLVRLAASGIVRHLFGQSIFDSWFLDCRSAQMVPEVG
jgi:hypothetical protein